MLRCPIYAPTISGSSATMVATTSVSVVSATTVTTSMVSGGSPQSLWAMINQFQFFMLYPMIGAYVPDNIVNFLQGVDFCLFNFNFIPIPKSGAYDSFISFFDWEQTNSYMSTIGLESVWMIVNQIKLFLTFIFLMLLHIPAIYLFRKFRQKRNWWGKFVSFIFKFFTFSVYLRTILEAFLVILLTSLNEFYVHDLGGGSKITSFWFSVALVLWLLAFWIATFIIAKRGSKPSYDPEATYLNEIVDETKTKFLSRLFVFTLLTRIIMSVSWVVFTQNLKMLIRISVFVAIQLNFFNIVNSCQAFWESIW